MEKTEEQICPSEKWKPELCILKALKMKDDNLSDDKSSLQVSVLAFFKLSTKSYTEQSVELSQFQSAG